MAYILSRPRCVELHWLKYHCLFLFHHRQFPRRGMGDWVLLHFLWCDVWLPKDTIIAYYVLDSPRRSMQKLSLYCDMCFFWYFEDTSFVKIRTIHRSVTRRKNIMFFFFIRITVYCCTHRLFVCNCIIAHFKINGYIYKLHRSSLRLWKEEYKGAGQK